MRDNIRESFTGMIISIDYIWKNFEIYSTTDGSFEEW